MCCKQFETASTNNYVCGPNCGAKTRDVAWSWQVHHILLLRSRTFALEVVMEYCLKLAELLARPEP